MAKKQSVRQLIDNLSPDINTLTKLVLNDRAKGINFDESKYGMPLLHKCEILIDIVYKTEFSDYFHLEDEIRGEGILSAMQAIHKCDWTINEFSKYIFNSIYTRIANYVTSQNMNISVPLSDLLEEDPALAEPYSMQAQFADDDNARYVLKMLVDNLEQEEIKVLQHLLSGNGRTSETIAKSTGISARKATQHKATIEEILKLIIENEAHRRPDVNCSLKNLLEEAIKSKQQKRNKGMGED